MSTEPLSCSNRPLLKALTAALGASAPPPKKWLQQVLEDEYDAAASAIIAPQHPSRKELQLLARQRATLRLQGRPCSDFAQQLARLCSKQASQPLLGLDARVDWLLNLREPRPPKAGGPYQECDRIYHQVAFEFRAELRIFAVLHELRAAVALPLASFFLSTGEFSERGVKRIVDTVLLVTNVLEWGIESKRGGECLRRIQAIHARYRIPNDAMKYVLLGIAFVPIDFNQRLGWRPFSEEEKRGWVQAFVQLGKNLGVGALDAPHEQLLRWYNDYSQRHAKYSPKKRQLVESVMIQVLSRYPHTLRPIILAALVAGMDEAYLGATRLPRVPQQLHTALRRAFTVLGKQLAKAQPGPWLQSLQLSSVYPAGYTVDQLGPPQRSKYFPTPSERRWSWQELRSVAEAGRLVLAVDSDVLDLTTFAKTHPGGANVLIRHAGMDASAAFRGANHSAEVDTLKLNYRVGKIDATENEQSVNKQAPHLDEKATDSDSDYSRRDPPLLQPRTISEWAQEVLPILQRTQTATQFTRQNVSDCLNQLVEATDLEQASARRATL